MFRIKIHFISIIPWKYHFQHPPKYHVKGKLLLEVSASVFWNHGFIYDVIEISSADNLVRIRIDDLPLY